MADKAIAELRDSLWIMDKGLISFAEIDQRINGICWQYRKMETPIDLQIRVDDSLLGLQLKSDYAGNLFRIVQEATHNGIKHSQATHFQIVFEKAPKHIRLTIADNGKGFDVLKKQEGEHYGMKNMKFRAAQMNAQLIITTEPGNGVKIIVLLPDEH